MSKDPFVTLIFRGGRFHGAAMPVESLPELAAYRDIVLAVAKTLFQKNNPGRQRLPKGFEAGLKLVLDRVEPGSTIPIVSRVSDDVPISTLFPNEEIDWFAKARDVVQGGIAAAKSDEALPADFPREILGRFNAFGRTLRDGESIVLAQPGVREGAVYDRGLRKWLILQAQATYEDDVNLLGEVRAADKDNDGFVLRLADGQKVPVHSPPLFFPLALRSLEASALVRVRGTGVFDGDGVLSKVTMASDVSLAEDGDEQARPGCQIPVETQLDSLRALEQGWFDKLSPAYSDDGLKWLTELLTALLHGFQLPSPYIYPTPDGLARAEWPGSGWDVVTSFDLIGRTAEALAARNASDEIHETSVTLQKPGGESELGRFIADHLTPGVPQRSNA